jgi:hypothetical protein
VVSEPNPNYFGELREQLESLLVHRGDGLMAKKTPAMNDVADYIEQRERQRENL